MSTPEELRPASIHRAVRGARAGERERPRRPAQLTISPQLAGAQNLLESIEPWLDLRAEPAHLDELGGELEAWSCLCLDEWLVLARIAAGEGADQRGDVRAHARAWPLRALELGDPGAHLGRSELFETTPVGGDGSAAALGLAPAPLRMEQLAAESAFAVTLLAHLYHALASSRPLIVSAPRSEFTRGAPLHALVCFARASLPLSLKRACSVRVYACDPGPFLRSPHALLALPEELAPRAFECAPDALGLRRGDPNARANLPGKTLAWAEAVFRNATERPAAWLRFAARQERAFASAGPASELQPQSVGTLYDLAAAEGAPPLVWAELLRRRLLPQAREQDSIPWDALLGAQDWRSFPPDALAALVLRSSEKLTAGERRLQAAAVRGIATAQIDLAPHVTPWWDPRDRSKQQRLLALLDAEPPALHGAWLAPLLAALDVGELEPHDLEIALRVDALATRLRESSADAASLGRAAAGSPAVLEVLSAATQRGELPPAWAESFLAQASDSAIAGWANARLASTHGWSAWGGAIGAGIARLRSLPASERVALRADLLRAAAELRASASSDPRDYVGLAELLCAQNPRERGWDHPLWKALLEAESAGPPDSAESWALCVTCAATDDSCASLQLSDLFPAGEGRGPAWLRSHASALLERAEIRQALPIGALVELASALAPQSSRALAAFMGEIDARMQSDAAETTAALIREGAWHAWRECTRGGIDAREIALAWLASPAWREPAAHDHAPTLEEWSRVMRDLAPQLSPGELERLLYRVGGHLGPTIRCFEDRQLEDLCRLAPGEQERALIADLWPLPQRQKRALMPVLLGEAAPGDAVETGAAHAAGDSLLEASALAEDLARDLLDALEAEAAVRSAPAQDDPAFRAAVRALPHSSAVAQVLRASTRERGGAYAQRLCARLCAVCAEHPQLLRQAEPGAARLAGLELLLGLSRPGAAASAIEAWIFSAAAHAGEALRDAQWWTALLSSVQHWIQEGGWAPPDDHPGPIAVLLRRAAASLEPAEQDAFQHALARVPLDTLHSVPGSEATMTRAITFFRTASDCGSAHDFAPDRSASARGYTLYSRLALRPAWVKKQARRGVTIGALRAQLAEAEGGIIVESDGSESRATLHVVGLAEPPAGALRLQPLGRESWVPVEGRTDIALERGDQLIVPIDAPAQRDLDELLRLIRGFPLDQQAALLGSLQPGSSAAVRRAGAAAQRWALPDAWARALRDPALLRTSALAAAALVLLAGGLAFFLLRGGESAVPQAEPVSAPSPRSDRESTSAASFQAPTQTQVPTQTQMPAEVQTPAEVQVRPPPELQPEPPTQAPEEPADARPSLDLTWMQSLFGELERGSKAGDSRLKRLWNHNFASSDRRPEVRKQGGLARLQTDVLRDLARSEQYERPAKEFSAGLLKLWVLFFGVDASGPGKHLWGNDDRFLDEDLSLQKTRALLRKLQDAGGASPQTAAAWTWLGCAIEPDRKSSAEAERRDPAGAVESPALRFAAGNMRCADLREVPYGLIRDLDERKSQYFKARAKKTPAPPPPRHRSAAGR